MATEYDTAKLVANGILAATENGWMHVGDVSHEGVCGNAAPRNQTFYEWAMSPENIYQDPSALSDQVKSLVNKSIADGKFSGIKSTSQVMSLIMDLTGVSMSDYRDRAAIYLAEENDESEAAKTKYHVISNIVNTAIDQIQNHLYGHRHITPSFVNRLSEANRTLFLKYTKKIESHDGVCNSAFMKFLLKCQSERVPQRTLDAMTSNEFSAAFGVWCRANKLLSAKQVLELDNLEWYEVNYSQFLKTKKMFYQFYRIYNHSIKQECQELGIKNRFEKIRAASSNFARSNLITAFADRLISMDLDKAAYVVQMFSLTGTFDGCVEAVERGFVTAGAMPDDPSFLKYIFKDGRGFVFRVINGIPVTEKLYNSPSTQTLEEIETEPNLELKRIRIERCAGNDQTAAAGWQRYLSMINPLIIDQRQNDVEMTKEVLFAYGPRLEKILVCTCKTGRVFALQVPQHVISCRDAQKELTGNDSTFVDIAPNEMPRVKTIGSLVPKMNIIGRS